MNTDNDIRFLLNAEETKYNKKIRYAMVSNCSSAIVPTFPLNTRVYSLSFEERSLLKCHWIFIRKRKRNNLVSISQSCYTDSYYQYKQKGMRKLELLNQLCKSVRALWWPTKLRPPIPKSFEDNTWKGFPLYINIFKKAMGHWSLSQKGPLLLPTQCHENSVYHQRVIPNACIAI